MDTVVLAMMLVMTNPQVERLVAQMGDDSFAKREHATLQLAEYGEPIRLRLILAQQHPDAEIASRATRLCSNIANAVHVRMLRKLDEIKYFPYIDSVWYDQKAKRYDGTHPRCQELLVYLVQRDDGMVDPFLGDSFPGYRAASRRWALAMLEEGRSVKDIRALFAVIKVNEMAMLANMVPGNMPRLVEEVVAPVEEKP